MIYLALSPKAADELRNGLDQLFAVGEETEALEAIHAELQSQLSKSQGDPIPDSADRAAKAAAKAAREALDA